MLDGSNDNPDLWAFGRSNTQALVSVYAMRMAAVFTLSVSTVAHRSTALPRWVTYPGYFAALVLLIAAGEHKWTQLIFPVWVLLVSLAILFTQPLPREPRERQDRDHGFDPTPPSGRPGLIAPAASAPLTRAG